MIKIFKINIKYGTIYWHDVVLGYVCRAAEGRLLVISTDDRNWMKFSHLKQQQRNPLCSIYVLDMAWLDI